MAQQLLHCNSACGQQTPLERYNETCTLSGITEPFRTAIWDEIATRHSGAARRYHTLAHLMHMFDFIRRSLKSGYSLRDPVAVDWAVWLHDAVYDPTSGTNEADSAALAAQLLAPAGVPPETIAKVQQLIMATADHHHVEGDSDCDLLVDADLCILGSSLQRYIEYAAAVRSEFSHLTDAQWCEGRARVLKSLLDREQLFLTDIGKSACEAEARANMAHEWRLVFGGQALQHNTLEEVEQEGPEDDVLASGDLDAPLAAAAEAEAAATNGTAAATSDGGDD